MSVRELEDALAAKLGRERPATDDWLHHGAVLHVADAADAHDLGIVAEDRMDEMAATLRRLRSEDRPADGYLLLACRHRPDEDSEPLARQVELDIYTCRKHVLWPDSDGNWEAALDAVTCLPLPAPAPAPAATTEPAPLPELPARAALILRWIEEGGQAEALRRIEQAIEAEVAAKVAADEN